MTIGGTATLSENPEVENYVNSINSYNVAKLIITDVNYDNITTYLSNDLKSIIFTDDVYSAILFRGEIKITTLSYEMVSYEIYGKAYKLTKQLANYDPVIETGYIRQLPYPTTLVDRDKNFGTYTDYLIHFQDVNPKQIIIPANQGVSVYNYGDGAIDEEKTKSTVVSSGDYDELGSEDNLYYDLESIASNNLHYINTKLATFNNIVLLYDHYFAVKSGVNVSKIEILATVRTRSLNQFAATTTSTDFPFLGLADHVGNDIDIEYINAADYGGVLTGSTAIDEISGITAVSPWITKRVEFTSSLSNYLESIAAVGNFTIYRVRSAFGGGQDLTDRKICGVRQLRIIVTLDSEQSPDKGMEKIASNSTTQLNFGTITNGQDPLQEGLGANDIYIITKTLDLQIADIATLWGETINTNITNDNILALTANYKNKYRHAVLQDIADLINGVWWYDASTDSYEIYSSDNILPVKQSDNINDLVITRSDIVGYGSGQWLLTKDVKQVRKEIVVTGSKNTDAHTEATGTSLTFALGDETEVINRPDLISNYAIQRFAEAEINKFKEPRYSLVITLNYSNPNQSYINVAKGKTVIVQLPDSSDTTVLNKTLLITSMQYDKSTESGKGGKNYVTLTLESREGLP